MQQRRPAHGHQGRRRCLIYLLGVCLGVIAIVTYLASAGSFSQYFATGGMHRLLANESASLPQQTAAPASVQQALASMDKNPRNREDRAAVINKLRAAVAQQQQQQQGVTGQQQRPQVELPQRRRDDVFFPIGTISNPKDPDMKDPWWRRKHPNHDALVSQSPQFPQAQAVTGQTAEACLRQAFGSGKEQDRKAYSQFGEDGILEGIFSCIGVTDRFYVEFGTESGKERSTRWLAEGHGFKGLLMDGSYRNPEINLHQELITAETISDLLHKHKVAFPVHDHMTVDLDLNTWHVAAGVLRGGWRPRSLSVEMNCNFLPHQSYVSPYYPDMWWQISCYYGASPLAVTRLVTFFGYQLIAVDNRGINLFFVHNSTLGPNPPQVHETTLSRLRPLSQVYPMLHVPCPGQQWVEVPENANFHVWTAFQGRTVQLNHQDRRDYFRVFYEVPQGTPAKLVSEPAAHDEFARYQNNFNFTLLDYRDIVVKAQTLAAQAAVTRQG